MAKVGIFFADGCEEIEGLAVVDICRRAGLEIETISIMGRDIVAGSHRIKFQTDAVFEDVDFDTLDGVILPAEAGNIAVRGSRKSERDHPGICRAEKTGGCNLCCTECLRSSRDIRGKDCCLPSGI